MSNDIGPVVYSLPKARRYNARSAERFLLPQSMPKAAIAKYDGLQFDPRNKAFQEPFAQAVFSFQKDNGLDADGLLGPATWGALVRLHASVERGQPHIIHNGRRILLQCSDPKARIVGLDAPGALDLTRTGHWGRARDRVIHGFVIHWGGKNAKHLRNYFAATDRKVSSHFAIDPTGAYQMLDTGVVAYHAGPANGGGVGIDLSQWPQPDRVHHYKDIQAIRNPESTPQARGLNPIAELHPDTARHARALVLALHDVFGLQPKAVRDEEGRLSAKWQTNKAGEMWGPDKATVYGHHHVCKRPGAKVDVIGWMNAVFAGTVLGD